MIFKTKKQQERYNSNVPNGVPKWIRVYDNGGRSFDRYTVVFTKKAITNTHGDRWFMYLGMSENPFHPQGFGQHGESDRQPVDRPTYGHLGKKIKFEDLPEDCKQLVLQDYLELWDFKDDEGNILN